MEKSKANALAEVKKELAKAEDDLREALAKAATMQLDLEDAHEKVL